MKILIIKLNTNPLPNDCPLCGNQTNPNIGAEIFLAGTENVVCFDCAEIHSPLLASLIVFAEMSRSFQQIETPALGDFLNFAHLSRLAQNAENAFGAEWEESNSNFRSPMNVYQSFGIQKTEVKDAA